MITCLDLSLGLLSVLRGRRLMDEIELVSDTTVAESSSFRSTRLCRLFQSELHYWFLSGGMTGQRIEFAMKRDDLQYSTVSIRDESVQNYLLDLGTSKTYVRGLYPRITQDEANTFVNRIFLARNDDHVFLFMPDARHRLPDRLSVNIVKALKLSNRRHVVFAEESQLKEMMEEGPYFLVTGQSAVENLYKVMFEQDSQVVNAVSSYFRMKSEHVIVTQGKKGFLYISKGKAYKVQSIKELGIGNSQPHALCAGLCSALDSGYDLERMLKLAFAFHTVSCINQGVDINLEHLKNCYNMAEVVRLNAQ